MVFNKFKTCLKNSNTRKVQYYGIKTYDDSSKEAYDDAFKIDENDIKSVIDSEEDSSPYNASSLIILYEPGDGKDYSLQEMQIPPLFR